MRTEQRQSQRYSQQHGAPAAADDDDEDARGGDGPGGDPDVPEFGEDAATATWQCVDCDRWNHPDVGYCEYCCGNGGDDGLGGEEELGLSDASSDVILVDGAGEALAPPPAPKNHRSETSSPPPVPSTRNMSPPPDVIEID
jgi:hypothetical protein